MNDAHFETYQEMQNFIEFDGSDTERLKALAPVFAKHGAKITDTFYASLGEYEKTAAIIEGRVDKLKATHGVWMGQLFEGEYGRPFFDQQYRIGQVHVTQNINPEYVEAVTSVLRTYGRIAIYEEMGSNDEAGAHYDSLCKVLDLALLTINLAYADERIDRISLVTGMSRKLIENLVKRGGSKKAKG